MIYIRIVSSSQRLGGQHPHAHQFRSWDRPSQICIREEFNPAPAPEVQVLLSKGIRIIGTENWVERLVRAA
jgi:hypothetical protein